MAKAARMVSGRPSPLWCLLVARVGAQRRGRWRGLPLVTAAALMALVPVVAVTAVAAVAAAGLAMLMLVPMAVAAIIEERARFST